MNFTETDVTQLNEIGISTSLAEKQINDFKNGFPFLNLVRPATIGDGLLKLDEQGEKEAVDFYEKQSVSLEVVKFVPASGAASRMFKALFSFMEKYENTDEAYEKFTAERGPVYQFFKNIENFAFFNTLKDTLTKEGKKLEKILLERRYNEILSAYLEEEGMGYGTLPKGLLEFHGYEQNARTPVEEHMVEGANYAKDKDGNVRLHLTVSPEHQEKFIEKIESVRQYYEEKFNVKFDISFSTQKKSTDTIAVNLDNTPFRNGDGSILFRPGGHGALLANLNDIHADVIFIKNIDNVVPDKIKDTTYTYKKAIGGILLQYQQQIFEMLHQLDATTIHDETIDEIFQFLEKQLCTESTEPFDHKTKEEKIAYLKQKLNRPLRICGMVKNEGEPGGGPFWAVNNDGTVSLQVVESAQIDGDDEAQQNIANNATHFNPVDLVCAVKNYKGEKFDLMQCRDPKTGFISFKSKDGKDLKAQELPGLWNGSMSDWNTIFVEVPIITFNPVKTVNDLLREQHQ